MKEILKAIIRLEQLGMFTGAVDNLDRDEIIFYPERGNITLKVKISLTTHKWGVKYLINSNEKYSQIGKDLDEMIEVIRNSLN